VPEFWDGKLEDAECDKRRMREESPGAQDMSAEDLNAEDLAAEGLDAEDGNIEAGISPLSGQ
jgi:hypothetical protein